MLTVLSGKFHPSLEGVFASRIKTLKKDPLIRLAVVVPGRRLIDRLEHRLASEGTYVNVHFHTFASWAEDVVASEGPLPKPILSDPLFYDTLVKTIIREDRPFRSFEELAVPEGFPSAVRATLRDLLDAGINENNVEMAAQEDFAGQDLDLGSLRSLLQLYRLYLKRISKLPVLPRSEILKKAIELAPASKFLQSFSEILYYGFYDLTGLQSDFFQAVVKNHPSTYFFPYVKDDPAYDFAKRFRDTFVQPVMQQEDVVESSIDHRPPARIFNVSGLRDEAWIVAGEIRRLHDEEKIPFSEIAVIARNKERLGHGLPEMLAARHVPFHSTARRSLSELPWVQEFLRTLENKTGEPAQSTWMEFIDRALESAQLDSLLTEALESLRVFAVMKAKVSRVEFLDVLRERLTQTEWRADAQADAGVSLLHAEAARGLAFKAVFLIGVEEKVFPRIIREDPFLRDDARFALNQTLGHKIGQKLTALEEERLLFEILTEAASARLYFTYQRTDVSGAVVGASPFLRAFAHERGFDMNGATQSVPRATLEKIAQQKPATIGAHDALMGLLAAGREKDARQLAKGLGFDERSLALGLAHEKELHSFKEPHALDGIVGPLSNADLFPRGQASASAFETYGQCPFQFFARRLLELEPAEELEIQERLAADVRGTMVHKFLQEFYGQRKIDRFDDVFKQTIGDVAAADVQLPPLLWQVIQSQLKDQLFRFVNDDLKQIAETGFEPWLLEEQVATPLDPPLDFTTWVGVIDRVDKKGAEISVVDYKTGRPPAVKRISTLAVKGLKAQPALYLLLVEKILQRMKASTAAMDFSFLYLGDQTERRTLTGDQWKELRGPLTKTLRAQGDLMKDGVFVIQPGDYCRYCEMAPICRKNHTLSTLRARRGVGEKIMAIREGKAGE